MLIDNALCSDLMIVAKKPVDKPETRAENITQIPPDSSPRFRIVDYATFIYIALIAILLMFFHKGVGQWFLIVLGHLLLIVVLMGFVTFADNHSNKIIRFFRDTYPFFLYSFMFIEVSRIINILFPFWLEPHLIAWDQALFGVNPTVWFGRHYQPRLTEFMAFSYWSYYVLIPAAGFTLYFRKDRRLYHSYVLTSSLTLYICYFSYLFLSARGPHETLAILHTARMPHGFFTNLVSSIQNNAAVSGAAFPSSHVTAVWVVLIYMFKLRKAIGLVLLPLVVSLTVSVVFMRYHYAIDAIAGVVLVALTYSLTNLLQHRFAKTHLGVSRV